MTETWPFGPAGTGATLTASLSSGTPLYSTAAHEPFQYIATLPALNMSPGLVSVICCTVGDAPSLTSEVQNSTPLSASGESKPLLVPAASMTWPPADGIVS